MAPGDSEDRRWLCSHLVQLAFESDSYSPQTVLLEEIGPSGASLAVESDYPSGLRLKVAAEGLNVSAVTHECRSRETDFRLEIRFVDFQWDAAVWMPDHLFLPPRRQRKAKGAAET